MARNTFFLAGATAAISVPLGTLLAWLVARTDLVGRRLAILVLGAMLFVPLYLQAAAWQAGFGLQGWYTLALGGPAWLEGWTGAVWVHALAALPWVVLIAAAGFRLVEPELEEEALLDSSSRQVLFHVTLPAALPAVGAAALWVAVLTAGEMTVTDLFAVRTYAEELYTLLALGDSPREVARALAPGLMAVLAMVLAGLAIVARLAPAQRPMSAQARLMFRLGRWQVPCAVLVAAMLLVLAGVPLISLGYKAGVTVTDTAAGRVRAWSPLKCLELIATSPIAYRREFGWSLLIGALAAISAAAAGLILAWAARWGRFSSRAVLVLAAVCLAMPGPFIGLGVIWLLNRPDAPGLVALYDRSILAPWLALSIRGLAPAVLILWHALRTTPQEILDAAAVDGAGCAATLWRIVLPSRLAALALAATVALAASLGDLAASILVVPPGVTTLSIRIFGLLHYGVEDQVAGICLALVAGFAAIAFVAGWLGRRYLSEL